MPIVLLPLWMLGCWVGAAPIQPVEIEAEKPFMPSGRQLEGLVITIDAGHGGSAHSAGYSGSARGINSGVVEGDLNLLVALQLWHYLHRAGATVHMTRWDDRKVTAGDTPRAEELGRRVRLAVDSRSHLLVSLHHNSAPRRSADGVVVCIWPTDSAARDQPLERALERCLREEVERTVHHAESFPPYLLEHPLVAGCDVPSAIVEFGFLSNSEFDAWVSQRGRHRDEARGAYEGIARMWREHREELETLRGRTFGEAGGRDGRASTRPATSAPWTWIDDAVARRTNLHRTLWPFDRPPQTARDITWLAEQYRRRVLSDATFFYLKVASERDGDAWRIQVATNAPRTARAFQRVIQRLNAGSMQFELISLPADRLGEARFGVTRAPMALVRARPDETAGVDTQLLLGDRVMLLDENADGSYLLLHAADGYVGWVRADAILQMDEAAFSEWEQAATATIRTDVSVDDLRLPAGARLPLLKVEGDGALLRLPSGTPATDGEAAVSVACSKLQLPPSDAPGRVAAVTATEFLTAPYLFGGRSRLGLDCSGLTGAAYAAVGLSLPRDARQQVLVGQLVATPWHIPPLRPGDLLFFCDDTGRVSHTGVALGGKRFIHASPPEVQVSSLDPDDPLYSAHWHERFALARRPMP